MSKLAHSNDDTMTIIEADQRNIKRGAIKGPVSSSYYAVEDGWKLGDPIGAGATEVEAIESLMKIVEA